MSAADEEIRLETVDLSFLYSKLQQLKETCFKCKNQNSKNLAMEKSY